MTESFRIYYLSLSSTGKRELAREAGTSVAYLSHLAHGHRNPGAGVIRRLMQADRKITYEMMGM